MRRENKKKPLLKPFSVLRGAFYLVEAAGVEPASGNTPLQASTSLVPYGLVIYRAPTPQEPGVFSTIRCIVSPSCPLEKHGGYPADDARSGTRERPEEQWLYLRSHSVCIVVCDYI